METLGNNRKLLAIIILNRYRYNGGIYDTDWNIKVKGKPENIVETDHPPPGSLSHQFQRTISTKYICTINDENILLRNILGNSDTTEI